MTPEKLFHELLGFGIHLEVVESRFDHASSTVFLEIRDTPHLWETLRCPTDGALFFYWLMNFSDDPRAKMEMIKPGCAQPVGKSRIK
jgi:hypothetical protein